MPPSPNVSITTITTTTVQSSSTTGSGHSNSTLSTVGVSAPCMSVALSSSTGSGNRHQNGASPSCLNLTSAFPETKSIHLSTPLLQLQVLASNTPITTLSLLLGLHCLKQPTELISIALFSAWSTMCPTHSKVTHHVFFEPCPFYFSTICLHHSSLNLSYF